MTQPNTSERAIRLRVKRYLQIRSAERAVAPSLRFRDTAATAASARELASRLIGHHRSLCERPDDLFDPVPVEIVPGDFDQIDSFLDAYSKRLNTTIDKTPHSQFRATLPMTVEYHADEARALLDYCLDDAKVALRRVDLIDYLVTTLSSRSENGMRHVVREPAKSSRRMQAVSELVDREVGDSLAEVERRIAEAVTELADLEDVAIVVDEIRTLKRSLGRQFFASSVLRKIVEFNVSVANHFEALLDSERAMDGNIVQYFRER